MPKTKDLYPDRKEEMRATFVLKYEHNNFSHYSTEDEDFPIKTVYVREPWCNETKAFVLTIKTE